METVTVVAKTGDQMQDWLYIKFGKQIREDADRRCGVVQFPAYKDKPTRYSVYRSALSEYAENYEIDLEVEDHVSGPLIWIKWYSRVAGGCIRCEGIDCQDANVYRGETAAALAERLYNWAREPRTYNQFRHRCHVETVVDVIAEGQS